MQQGRNPAAEKQKAKAADARDWTVRHLAKDYRAQRRVSLAHSTQVSYGRHLKRVEKKLGALTVREIEASDVVALIEGAGLTWGESNMLLITTKCLFTHACGKRLINANPCHGIMLSALLGERPPRRQRLMLTREELKLLLAAPMRRRNALAIRILLATAVRSAELYQAKWAHVDLDGAQWHIPKSKTGAAMDVPLEVEPRPASGTGIIARLGLARDLKLSVPLQLPAYQVKRRHRPGAHAAAGVSAVLASELPVQHDQRLHVFGQHEAQLLAGMTEAVELPLEPHLRVLPRQLAKQLHGRVPLGALDVPQDVARHVQPPRGRVAHERGRWHEGAFGVLVAEGEQALGAAHAGQDLFACGHVDAGAEAGHAAPEGAACLPRASPRFHAGWLSQEGLRSWVSSVTNIIHLLAVRGCGWRGSGGLRVKTPWRRVGSAEVRVDDRRSAVAQVFGDGLARMCVQRRVHRAAAGHRGRLAGHRAVGIGRVLVAQAVRHHLQAGAGDAMAFHHVAQPPLGLRQHAAWVADAVIGPDRHAAGLRHGGLALRAVDGQQAVAATLGAAVRVQVARRAVGGAAGLLRGQHVLVGPRHQAFLEAQAEGLHRPQRRGGVPIVGFHLAEHRVDQAA